MSTSKQEGATIADLATQAARHLILIGGDGIEWRTGTYLEDQAVITFAHEASPGDRVTGHSGDGREISLEVEAFDSGTGLALLKAPEVGTAVVPHDTPLRIGDPVFTLAYPSPEGVEIQAAVLRFIGNETTTPSGRRLASYLQIDRALPRGFGGAPLFGSSGGFLGYHVVDRDPWQSYVIPAAELASLVGDLRAGRRPQTAYLGVRTVPADLEEGRRNAASHDDSIALVVVGTDEGGPASKAGLQAGDIILSLGGSPITDQAGLATVLLNMGRGSTESATAATEIRVLRGNEVRGLTIVPELRDLGSRPRGHGHPWRGRRHRR